MKLFVKFLLFIILIAVVNVCEAKKNKPTVSLSEIGPGWSKTSVNATIFRKNSIVSANGFQFVAYYDSLANVVIAKRKLGTDNWSLKTTQYKGNVSDAHNIISIMVDGNGYLHMSWDHHNNKLNYCKSTAPYGIDMGEKQTMIGTHENVISYPEFYRFNNGDLLFVYRDGGSGNGNLVLNNYNCKSGKWSRVQTNLIDGEGKRNAYWQMYIDKNSHILLSWVWRETPDVASNHDMCYAQSDDGGITWGNSKGELYQLPINMGSAEVVYPISQKSNLMNQTSMTADDEGNAYIATYYKGKEDDCTQFHLIYQYKNKWEHTTVTNRTTDFNLGGMGSRSVPISRPQVVIEGNGNRKKIFVFYRDEAFDNKVCISSSSITKMKWEMNIVSPISVGRWEPSYDSELWKTEHKLHLYLQNVGQGQGETTVEMDPQMVSILEID